MSQIRPARAFMAVLGRDLARQLVSAPQLVLLFFLAILVGLMILAPRIVEPPGATKPTIAALAPSDVIAAVSASEPTWHIRPISASSSSAPSVRSDRASAGVDVVVIVRGTTVDVQVEKASEVAQASVVGERFAAALLSISAGVAPPTLEYGFVIDDSDAALTRLITLVSVLLAFTIVTARAIWSYGALSRDLAFGLFDAVLARSSPIGMLGGRIGAAAVAGLVQIGTLALLAAIALRLMGDGAVAGRVVQLTVSVSLWSGAGIALYSALAMVLVLMFRGKGEASLGIAMQLIGFVSFGIVVVALLDPGAGWIGVASVIPPLSVLLLPMRISEGLATTADVVVSAGLMAAVSVALFWLALRVWRAATTTDGAAAMWRAVLRRNASESTRHGSDGDVAGPRESPATTTGVQP